MRNTIRYAGQRIALTGVILAAAGCSAPMHDYETLAAKTTADLNTKMQQYADAAQRFDTIRENSQRTLELQTMAAKGVTDMRLDLFGLSNDPRQKLFSNLQQASERAQQIRQQQPSSAVPITPLKPPAEIADTATTLDKLSRDLSTKDQANELEAYFKEVYGDLQKDQAAKQAENASAAPTVPAPATTPAAIAPPSSP